MRKFIVSVLCALVISVPVSAVPINAAAVQEPAFSDISGHWAEETINRFASYGIINVSEESYRPADNITVAEFSAMLDMLMKYHETAAYDTEVYKDLDRNEWYADPMLRLARAGVIAPDREGKLFPTELLTRADEAVMLAKAFSLTPVLGSSEFTDDDTIYPYSKPYVKAMHEKGYITGFSSMGGYAYRPEQPVTRAEAVGMLGKLITDYVSASGEFTDNVEGNLLVASPDVTLKEITISGDLYIAEGALGTIKLEDVTVTGDTYIRSAGVIEINNSRLGNIIVNDLSDKISLKTTGAININQIEMRSGGAIEANQNEYGFIRNVVIPYDFPSSEKVTFSGAFRRMDNQAYASNIDSMKATFNNSDVVLLKESSVSASRPADNRIEVEVSSTVAGTAHILILKEEMKDGPAKEQIVDGDIDEINDYVFDFGHFRVYPSNTESFSFTGANQTLEADDQGHIAYVIIETESGALIELSSEPITFSSGVERLYVKDETNIIATLSRPFKDGAAVEDTFDLFVSNEKADMAPVQFRAYNVLPEETGASRVYRLSLIYGDELTDDDEVTLIPKDGNEENGVTERADLAGRLPYSVEVQSAADNQILVIGETKGNIDLFFVLTDRIVDDFDLLGDSIAREDFPVETADVRYEALREQDGSFEFRISGFIDIPEYYYLYAVAGFESSEEYAEVEVYPIKSLE